MKLQLSGRIFSFLVASPEPLQTWAPFATTAVLPRWVVWMPHINACCGRHLKHLSTLICGGESNDNRNVFALPFFAATLCASSSGYARLHSGSVVPLQTTMFLVCPVFRIIAKRSSINDFEGFIVILRIGIIPLSVLHGLDGIRDILPLYLPALQGIALPHPRIRETYYCHSKKLFQLREYTLGTLFIMLN
jgi:hypothetical protein